MAEAISKSSQDTSNKPASSSVSSPGVLRGATGTGQVISEASIQKIIHQGFSREQAIQELRAANGNVELATAVLLAKSLQMPTS